MNIQQLTSKNMPAWAGVVLAVGGLLSGAGAMWTQIEETFPALFASDTSYYEEYTNHFDEVPIHTNTFSYPEVGDVEVAFYESDGCLLFTAPGRERTWLTRSALGLGLPGSGLDVVMPLLAGLGLIDDPPCLVEGCQNPHRGEFEIRIGNTQTIDGVRWTRVHRMFADGCEHYQLRREDGLWDDDEEGRPIVCWTRCVHGKDP